ncbi:MAG: 5-(carboxyamino)imidazole ribonucleotide synthase [Vicingaceae bacterium]|nr:5-(carboxyamino)imidazole ribonucleotide synthase [Vicingaceae bacterium]
MKQPISSDFKLGILGGGQLGKMLTLAASNIDVNTYVLDPNGECPAVTTCTGLTVGSFNDYDAVYQFGQDKDVITVEIESVNIDALRKLEGEGKEVYPDTNSLSIIQDKGLQKQFYKDNKIATSAFALYEDTDAIKAALANGTVTYPFVQKLRTGGYDGKGVAVLKNEADLNLLLEGKSVVEQMVDINKEIAVIVARNIKGEVKCFPSVEMEFNPKANLVEFLFSPAAISDAHEQEAEQLSRSIVEHLDFVGLLAIELFIDNNGEMFVNEVAPRPHNSGHQTIEGNMTSQYEQHLRAILGYPLGSTAITLPSVMINILGEEGYEGNVIYDGIENCMAVEGANFHIYGKKITKSFRKMGHATVIDKDLESAKKKANYIKEHLKVIA